MEYRQLGASGLRVPALSFGAGTFGGSGPLFGAWGNSDAAEARKLVDICLEAGVTLFEAVGCDECTEGYKGRTGIYQVMPMSEQIQAIILEGGNAMQIAEQARREGVRSLRQSGLAKVRQGLTSIEEVLGVTNE